ncbi:MAG: T9SS type A sorting domain-containing protein [Pricia sp.]
MKKLLLALILLYGPMNSLLFGQAILEPSAGNGGAYETIEAADFGFEAPDVEGSSVCVAGGEGDHTSFGDHVTQTFDSELDRNVFIFYSHLNEDSDRCRNFDRIRTELKGSTSDDPELQHEYGDTSYYTWQFRLAEDFVGASTFCHVFQNKAQGGDDDGFPVITITPRESIVEVKHDAGDENPNGSLGRLVTAPLSDFKGKWVEVSMRQVHRNDGEFYVKISDIATGSVLLEYENLDIDMFRGDETSDDVISRPKFGIYRSIATTAPLKDEEVLFAGFCSSETSADLCPSLLSFDGGLPETASGLLPLDGVVNVPTTMPLLWERAEGADSYNVYFGTSPEPALAANSVSTTYTADLEPATTYYFQIGSLNSEGERLSALKQFTTLADPDDGTWEVARGHARPEQEAPQFFDFDSNITGFDAEVDRVENISDEDTNAGYCFFSGPKDADGNGNYRWRNDLEEGQEVTAVVRLRPIDGNTNISFIEFRGLGWRQKIRINQNTVKFESADGDPEVAFPSGYWGENEDAYRVLRFTFANDPNGGPMLTTLYLDESPDPLGTFASDTDTTSNYIDIGRAGSSNYGACFDYIAVNETGAFAPNSEPTLPSDLTLPVEPGALSGLLPLNGSQDVPLYMPLIWNAASDAAEYNVYLGSSPDNLSLASTVTGTSYVPEMAPNTSYFYQIEAVNNNGKSLSDVVSYTTLENADDGNWNVARGHARPEIEAPHFFSFNTDLTMVVIDETQAIGDEPGNNSYCFLSGPKENGNSNYRWRYTELADEETTLVTRLRPLEDNGNITFIEFRGLGWRQKLRINRTSIKFESAPEEPEVQFPSGFWDDNDFHTLRVTYNENPTSGEAMVTSVYLDENPTPIGSFPSEEDTTSEYLEIGRAGSSDYGACFDYIAVNPTGSYAPGEGDGEVLPADLILPQQVQACSAPTDFSAILLSKWRAKLEWNEVSDAKFYSIRYRRTKGTPWWYYRFSRAPQVVVYGLFERQSYIYQVKAYCEATREFTEWSEVQNIEPERVSSKAFTATAAKASVVNLQQNYANDGISVYPNPTTDFIEVFMNDRTLQSYTIYNAAGQKLKFGTSSERIGVSDLSPATYFIEVIDGSNNKEVLHFIKN